MVRYYFPLLDQNGAADMVYVKYPIVEGNGDISIKAKSSLRILLGVGDNSQIYQIAVGSGFEAILTLSVQSEPSTGQSLSFFANKENNQIEYLGDSVFTTYNNRRVKC